MDWFPTIVMVMAIVLVGLQGALLSLHRGDAGYKKFAGVLDLLLAGSGFLAYLLFSQGALILSPEYGVLLGQGITAWMWSVLTLLLLPLGLGLALHSARCARERKNQLRTIALGSLVIGVISLVRMLMLNPEGPSSFRVFYLDLWSFPLLAFVLACISEWAFAACGVENRVSRVCGICFALSAFAFSAARRAQGGFQFADPLTLQVWQTTAKICLPLFLTLITWMALSGQGRWNRFQLVQIAGSILAALVGLWTAFVLGTTELWFFWPALVCFAVLLLIALPRLRSWIPEMLLKDRWQKGYWDDVLVLLAAILILASVIDLSHYALLDPAWDLILLIVSWVMLTEIVSGLPLCSILRKAAKTIPRLASHFPPFRKKSEEPTSQPMPQPAAETSKTSSLGQAAGVAVFRVALLLVFVAIISELFNAGKTVVMPFTTIVAADAGKDDNTGKIVANRIVNTIGLLGQELRPDLMIADKSGKTSWAPATSNEGADVQAALAGNTLQVLGPTISVPLSFFATPVQRPVRWLLGVRVIQGSVHKIGKELVVLASSSTGQTWRVTADQGEAEVPEDVADKLAYMIVSSDPNLTKLGMTSSWEALPDFRAGLADWKKFERERDFDTLGSAIESFRSAVRKDPGFALAYYRLGLALEADGQPGAAVSAFRSSIKANPGFVAAHIALAEALDSYDAHLDEPLAPLAKVTLPQPDSTEADRLDDAKLRRIDAQSLLHHVLSELSSNSSRSDRSAAYVGLCRNARARIDSAGPDASESLIYAAFFYCKRAEYLYRKIPTALQSDPGVKGNELYVLAELGNILFRTAEISAPKSTTAGEDWLCTPATSFIRKSLFGNTYVAHAENYYRQALQIRPEDPIVRCSAALASWNTHEGNRAKAQMQRLAFDSAAHITLAGELVGYARYYAKRGWFDAAKEMYQSALDEYESAIGLDPFSIDARNGYAYTVYEWHLKSSNPVLLDPPKEWMYELAEQRATEGKRLTEENGRRATHAMIQSTLGEVLLARGNPDRALNELREIFAPEGRPPDIGKDEFGHNDEIRWDRAQASVCAGLKQGTLTQESRREAEEQLRIIQKHEAGREDKRFGANLTLEYLRTNCARFGRSVSKPFSSPSDLQSAASRP